jgi:outer membrane protein assembly factor BamA
LKGAFFVDAGNIWLRKKDEIRPGAEFRLSKFGEQLAIGSGFGLRVDFIFFIFRLDIGVPIKDPTLYGNKKYVYKKLQLKDLNFNFGIGYPF